MNGELEGVLVDELTWVIQDKTIGVTDNNQYKMCSQSRNISKKKDFTINNEINLPFCCGMVMWK